MSLMDGKFESTPSDSVLIELGLLPLRLGEVETRLEAIGTRAVFLVPVVAVEPN